MLLFIVDSLKNNGFLVSQLNFYFIKINLNYLLNVNILAPDA